MEFLDTKLSKKSSVDPLVPRFKFVHKLQCFQGFLRPKKNVFRDLVVNLAEMSKDFLISMSIFFKITETKLIQSLFVTFE